MTMMRIAEVAQRSGVPATTLRYYEGIGLLAPAGRSENGYRVYVDRDLARLAFISRAKQLDIRLDELRELVDVWDADDCSQVQHRMAAVVNARVAETQGRIADLVELDSQLQAAANRLSSVPAADGGCAPGCACMAVPAEPVAALPFPTARVPTAADAASVCCTLDSKSASSRAGEWAAVAQKAIGREEISEGVALDFAADALVIGVIARLAAAESACCGALRFTITIHAAGVRLAVVAPPESREIVRTVFR
ncbi:MAG: MerR family transcriptional regulator [Mycobacteriales bacterium]